MPGFLYLRKPMSRLISRLMTGEDSGPCSRLARQTQTGTGWFASAVIVAELRAASP